MANPYTLTFSDRATGDLKRLDKAIAARILNKLEWLAQSAETVAHVPLKGEFGGFYRLRIGDYRVLYTLQP